MSSPNRKIRWGVLGYANIASRSVIPAIQHASNSEFCALASRDTAKLAECKAKFNISRLYQSYDELLRDPELDAVYIPLPNSMHREWTIKAANHGKHVLCEKPLALNAAETREMMAVCVSNRVTLMEAFMYRYTDRTRKVLEVLKSGELGEIKFISSTFRFLLANADSIKYQQQLGGGSLYDVGCYPVNFIGMVLETIGQSAIPEKISAQAVMENGVDVIFSGVVKYPSGIVATLNSGFKTHRRVFSEIVGTNGVLEIPDTFWDNAGTLILNTGDERREIPVAQSDRYRLEVEDFSDAILKNRPPHFSLNETLRNMEMIDRLYAECGK